MNLSRWLAAAAILMLSAVNGYTQTDQGKLTGTLRDSSSAFVEGARVTVRNDRTGDERTAVSNNQGFFFIASLKPSTYTIRAEKPGFAPIEYPAIPLAVGQELTLDFELRPAGVQEAITVTAAAPVLDLSSARMGVNVSTREVDGLPVNGRQMSQLLLQAPGSQNAGTGTWQDIRFSGRAVEQNVIRYDGIEGSAIIDAAPGNLNGEIPTPFKLQASLENVQEFRVESSSYPAEYGTGTGGQVSVITKSGSNAFHGSAFEYVRSDKLDAPNYFDTAAGLPKSKLKQNQFGGSLGGRILQDRVFFFSSYEAYRLDAGLNFVEAVPSAAAWARAVPAIAALRPGFLAPGAVILDGKSSNADFDIAQLQGTQGVREHALSGRLDFKVSNKWSSYVRVFHDQGTNNQPEGVTGRNVHITDDPTNAVYSLQGILSEKTTNEFKFGYNAAPTRIEGQAPTINGIDFSRIAINLSGSVANTGIAGQGASSGIAVPGGLVRANSATNGHGQPYDPYSLTFADTLSRVTGNHYLKTGGEFRAIRMATDRIGGTTYTFPNITAFLANQAQSVQYLGDVSEPSVFNDGATGPRHTRQNYIIAFAQDEWHASPKITLNYGLRYDYYTPMAEANDLIVKFNIDTGVIDPNTTPLFASRKSNVQPRVSGTFSPTAKTLVRGGFGMFVGPGQTEDQIQPIESDRISSTISNSAFPINTGLLRANFVNNPGNRSYQPRAYANEYTIPERIYQYTASVQQEVGASMAATVAYVGSQGRNLFLRSVANQITQVVTNPNPANAALVVRQFSTVQRDAAGNVTGVQNPFAEVDYKTSGGRDNYNAMQLSLTRRAVRGLTMNVQYTLGRSRGNTGGSNEALTAGNNARTLDQFDYDTGYNNFDVRHTFNLSAVYEKRGWQIGGILNARSGLPVDVRVTRPDVVYRDMAGNIFANPAADRVAIINTPGGGASRNVRRPDLIPGVDPFISNGGLLFLNPAAFATPAPGAFGNLERNSIHGPNFRQVDLVFGRRLPVGGPANLELRMEVFNVFNADNFSNPVGTLPSALPANSVTEANRLQPGQPYTNAAAGTFGTFTSTVGRTVGLGTNRQVQFAVRMNF
jgi:Carboxypeptidase regulatory-like domain/TonB dependent receptor